jgi:hypothetical protein
MKNLLIMLALLTSFSSFAFSINEGSYTSEEGCKVNIFKNYKGNYIVEYVSPEESEVYTDSYTSLLSDFSGATNGPGLCGDEEGLPVAKVKTTYRKLEVSCGGKLSVLDTSLKLYVDSKSNLTSLRYLSKVSLISGMGWGLPQPKKIKGNMICSGFTKD